MLDCGAVAGLADHVGQPGVTEGEGEVCRRDAVDAFDPEIGAVVPEEPGDWLTPPLRGLKKVVL